MTPTDPSTPRPSATRTAEDRPDRLHRADGPDRWMIDLAPVDSRRRRACESIATVADTAFGVRGLPGFDGSVSWAATYASGVYTGDVVPTLLPGPVWTTVNPRLDEPWTESVQVDLRRGIVRHRWRSERGDLMVRRFVSAADIGVAVQMVDGPPGVIDACEPLRRPQSHAELSVDTASIGEAELMVVRDVRSGACIAAAARDEVDDTPTSRSVLRLVGLGAGGSARARNQAIDRLAIAREEGAAGLARRHRAAWERRWDRCGTWFPLRADLERAVRFATFHLLAAGSIDGSDRRDRPDAADRGLAIGARGATGTSYRGHVFWDTDVFVVPALSAIAPSGARRALEYRWARLGAARERARREGRRGARFPWESAADGTEVTPTTAYDLHGNLQRIRTGEQELHITADVAWAVGNHVAWTGDEEFLAAHGLELLVETARYWASRAELDRDGVAHLRGVIGPDEYHEDVDDNVFTNVMVRHNLDLAAEVAARFGGCDPTELVTWRRLAEALEVRIDEQGRYEQFAGYDALEALSVREIGRPPLSADALLGRDTIAQTQIIKQPDVMMAYHLVPHLLDADAFERNLDLATERTAHGSSLSPAISGSLLLRARRWSEAVELLELAAFLDLDDLTGTTAGGLHLATMGGLWQAITVGMLGLRPTAAGLAVDPRVPPDLGPMRHRVMFRGQPVDVRVSGERGRVEAADEVCVVVAGDARVARRHDLRRSAAGWEFR